MDKNHLTNMADNISDLAEGCRWLAALARNAGEELKAADVEAKASQLDVSAAFCRELADEL